MAHSALSATVSSSSLVSFSNRGKNPRFLLFPIAITALRRRPLLLARRIGDCLKTRRTSSGFISASHSSAGFTNSGRGSSSFDFASLFDGEIRDAFVGVQLVGRKQCTGGTGIDTTGAGTAAIGGRQIGLKLKGCQDHAQEEP